jgi:hypothetical protein
LAPRLFFTGEQIRNGLPARERLGFQTFAVAIHA